MKDAPASNPSSGADGFIVWHLLALAADAAVIAAGLVMARLVGLKFAGVPNASLLILGAALAVASVTAAWLALGPFDKSIRFILAAVLCVTLLLFASTFLAMTGANVQFVIGTFIAGVVQFLLLQAPYWVLRSRHHLRVVHVDELTQHQSIEPLQYSLWQMLAVITLVAVVLGIGRAVVTVFRLFDRPSGGTLILVCLLAVMVGYNLLLAWPLIWGVLSPTGMRWKLITSLTLAAIAVAVAYPLTTSLIGTREGPWIYWLVFAPQPAYLLVHLLATRFSGFRLVTLGR